MGRQLPEAPRMLIHTTQWLWPRSLEAASVGRGASSGRVVLALEEVLVNGGGLLGGRHAPQAPYALGLVCILQALGVH